MARRGYGQFCGLARGLETVGERWALLIVRDLLVGPRRYTDLRKGLPRIPTNILSARLKELEAAGVISRQVRPRPDGSVVYALTEHGAGLEEAVLALGRWGALGMGAPRDGETVPSVVVRALATVQHRHMSRSRLVLAARHARRRGVELAVPLDPHPQSSHKRRHASPPFAALRSQAV